MTKCEEAAELGRCAGYAAATWVFDGNTAPETYARVLRGIEDGDPEILDAYRMPDLSGEYADDPTPATLAAMLELDPEDEDQAAELEDCCDAYCDGASEAFWAEVERAARYQVQS
jgi:hypothetical protein